MLPCNFCQPGTEVQREKNRKIFADKENNGDGEANDEDAKDCAEAAKYFPKSGDWAHVSITHL